MLAVLELDYWESVRPTIRLHKGHFVVPSVPEIPCLRPAVESFNKCLAVRNGGSVNDEGVLDRYWHCSEGGIYYSRPYSHLLEVYYGDY